jgi:hypothetical protein
MSYSSTNTLPNTVKLRQLQQVIDLLGYGKIPKHPDLPNMVGNYFWLDNDDYRSWS